MTLQRTFEELGEPHTSVKHSLLVNLSGLAGDEVEQFRRWWSSVEGKQRRTLVSRLVSLAEENVELDFSPVFRHCLYDPDPQVREEAVAGLWECDDRTLILPLVNLFKGDPAVTVRVASALALGKFATLAEGGKLLPRDATRIRDALLGALDDGRCDAKVRRRALEAAAPFNTPRVRELIQEAYASADVALKASAVYAMGKTADASWLPTIARETKSPETTIRYEAAGACGALGEEGAIPHLVALLKDEDQQVQLAAIHALGAIGGSLARRILLTHLKSAEEEPLKEAFEDALRLVEVEEEPLSFPLRPERGPASEQR